MIGAKMTHKKWGEGMVVGVNESNVTINFVSVGDKVFQMPQAIEQGFIKFSDREKQQAFTNELNDKRRKITLEDAKALAEKENKERKNNKMKIGNFSKRKDNAIERENNEVLYFYVFQGSSYQAEKTGGYIWAPIENEKGQAMHHWDRMLDVQKGDVVLHGFDSSIVAISIAKDKAYPSNRPLSYGDNAWIQTGRRVDLNYYVLRKPLSTKDFIEEIKELSVEKYSPFNSKGTGNMGYLFSINPELVKVFVEWIVKYDPEIKHIRGIDLLLKN